MMAKREKDRLYYEITREKPYGTFQMLLVGGATGSVVAFMIVSLVGACAGMEMDVLVLAFLIASFLGFVLGAVTIWLIQRYLGKWISDTTPGATNAAPVEAKETPETLEVPPENPVMAEDATKGKTVDFVFPELSPDEQ